MEKRKMQFVPTARLLTAVRLVKWIPAFAGKTAGGRYGMENGREGYVCDLTLRYR